MTDKTPEAVASTSELGSDGWPKLTKPARVGNGTFGVGVSSRLVVEAAQRMHEYSKSARQDGDEKRTDAFAELREAIRARQAEAQALIDAGKCPDCEGTGEGGGQFCGGFWKCPTCNGTGKPNVRGNL